MGKKLDVTATNSSNRASDPRPLVTLFAQKAATVSNE